MLYERLPPHGPIRAPDNSGGVLDLAALSLVAPLTGLADQQPRHLGVGRNLGRPAGRVPVSATGEHRQPYIVFDGVGDSVRRIHSSGCQSGIASDRHMASVRIPAINSWR